MGYLFKSIFMGLKNAILLLALLQIIGIDVNAQLPDNEPASVGVKVNSNHIQCSSALRPLRPLAGAPDPFYSYYWEFGDGKFSFEENPAHLYKDTGSYDIRLFATNNYDDGKPPPIRPKRIKVNSRNNSYALNNNPSFFKHGGAIEMRVNCMPRADEDMVLILGYRNEKMNTPLNGSMVLFYNERQFRKNNFDFSEERIYNDEKKTSLSSIIAFAPASEIRQSAYTGGPGVGSIEEENNGPVGRLSELISSKQKLFRQNDSWRFTDLQPGAEKYLFVTLHTTPEMIKDTNAVVEINGLFIPDNPAAEIEEYALDLQIVASHDPNRLMLKQRRLNYRFTGRRTEMVYTVRFQNTGRGSAKQALIRVGVPPVLDTRSLEILEMYPKCPFCNPGMKARQSCLDTIIRKDSIIFSFKHIYLPGLREQGIRDPDSTIGYVKYRMHFNRDLKKLPFESNAVIVFDNNPPISTNSPKGSFKPGRSPGLILGYNLFFGNQGKAENYFSIGASISPYSPYKKYLQAEGLVGYLQFPEQFLGAFTSNVDTLINSASFRIIGREIYTKRSIIKLDLVPLQLRYNINDFIGVGAGTLVSLDAYSKSTNREILHLIQPPNPSQTTLQKTYTLTKWFGYADIALFADLQAGMARVGPVAGIRYLHYLRNPLNALYLYLAWRW